MSAPIEIVSGPLSVWISPHGEAFPTIQTTPAGNWVKIGATGAGSISEDGLTISHPQEFFEVRTAGSTAVQKVFRTSESMIVSFSLFDISAPEYSRMLNNNTVGSVTAAAGVAGEKSVDIYRGMNVNVNGLLVRGSLSPGQDGAPVQYEIPKVYQASSPEVVYNKGVAAGLAFEFTAIFDATQSAGQELGRYVYQTADPVKE
ncbi:MAG: hypothetical protein OXL36_14310 [Bryobacterales bacterium]|nr:hypothetical protein [Bryobacterales bacterium]MDE0293696.1 hypothetical protein [Bryobacterales bacterium]